MSHLTFPKGVVIIIIIIIIKITEIIITIIIIVIIIIMIINSRVNQIQNKMHSALFHFLNRKIYDYVLFYKRLYILKNICARIHLNFCKKRMSKKFSVPEVHVETCELSMMDLFAKIVKDFQPFTISPKTFSSHRMLDRVLTKPLYTLSNSLILENCFIFSLSIMICPFHMRTRNQNIYIIDSRQIPVKKSTCVATFPSASASVL